MSLFETTLYFLIAPVAEGFAGFLCSEAGLRGCTLPMKTKKAAREHLFGDLKMGSEVTLVESEERCGPYAAAMRAYFATGDATALHALPVDWNSAPPFYRTAWKTCRAIPPGQTRTYQWLATRAGSPKAVRAAGQAMAHNPTPLFVPCHRVLATGGGLGGFSGGLEWKERLLAMEKK